MYKNEETINQKLREKLIAEYGSFIKELGKKSPTEIIDSSYEKVFKEDILFSIMRENLDYDRAKALLMSKNPLDECYRQWLKDDSTYMPELRDSIERRADALHRLEKEGNER